MDFYCFHFLYLSLLFPLPLLSLPHSGFAPHFVLYLLVLPMHLELFYIVLLLVLNFPFLGFILPTSFFSIQCLLFPLGKFICSDHLIYSSYIWQFYLAHRISLWPCSPAPIGLLVYWIVSHNIALIGFHSLCHILYDDDITSPLILPYLLKTDFRSLSFSSYGAS